jgi:hypothetical protein
MGVDDTYLPDSIIDQPDIITIAEANIIKQVPNYSTFTGDNLVYLEAVAVLECCILLCPSLAARLPKKEDGAHASFEWNIDWNKKKIEFTGEKDDYISQITGVTPSLSSFGVTYPKREWY